MSDGSESVHGGNRLSQALSYSIFMKRGEVGQLTVTLAPWSPLHDAGLIMARETRDASALQCQRPRSC